MIEWFSVVASCPEQQDEKPHLHTPDKSGNIVRVPTGRIVGLYRTT